MDKKEHQQLNELLHDLKEATEQHLAISTKLVAIAAKAGDMILRTAEGYGHTKKLTDNVESVNINGKWKIRCLSCREIFEIEKVSFGLCPRCGAILYTEVPCTIQVSSHG